MSTLQHQGIYLVTGALGGLGQDVTRTLLGTGAEVVALDISDNDLRTFQATLGDAAKRLTFHALDTTDAQAVEAQFAEYRTRRVLGIAHLVGGYTGGVPIDETPLDEFERMVNMNLRSAFVVLKAGAGLLKSQNKPAGIVCVGSVTGRSGGLHHGPYAATKAAVHALVRSSAADLAPHHIRVNAVLPAMIATPANLQMMPDADHSAWVTPIEVAETIQFLLSSGSLKVTGACIEVSGKSYTPG